MRGQIALVGMSDSGTNWLVRTMLASQIGNSLRYFREFFNPICNLRHAPVLSEGFGCEVASTVPMIARPSETQPRLYDLYNQTWRREDFTFTKENYSVFKIPFFDSQFDVVLLYREPASLWPPARLRVVTWYNAVYESILANRRDYPVEFQQQISQYATDLTIAERAEAGHALSIAYMRMMRDRYRLPLLTYSWLQSASVASLIDWANESVFSRYVHAEKWALEVTNTRRPPDQSDLTEPWLACHRKESHERA